MMLQPLMLFVYVRVTRMHLCLYKVILMFFCVNIMIFKQVKALQGRLRECTLDKLAPDHGIEEGIEMLGISDNRISCLLAEAQLLFQVSMSNDIHITKRLKV